MTGLVHSFAAEKAAEPGLWRVVPTALGLAFAGSAIVVGLVAIRFYTREENRPSRRSQVLTLPKGWDFKEYWASNLTLVTAVFTGLFTDKLEILTTNTTVLPVVMVTNGVAVGLLGAAPLVLTIARTPEGETRIAGWLVASILALGAAGTQLGVLVWCADRHLDLGDAQWILRPLGALAVVLLVAYGFSSVWRPLVAPRNAG
ncbi:hypothetical protein E1161_14620 [Saccharopolyspora aridisoli]|uniref:Uncharacterized protein n=1 Tax=Saccharopolyspora aridisoli TaxID=2530385 RepID=A0A4R4UZB6_9PSEU|nr:hypothetical protein [Saccharopolyspora aridisoli]TDC92169.1 hypothetical protein E1161_14620 [Saccharopolyspora aridisoli]